MKPIIFSTPMVKAILAGNKTQTRRIIKPQPLENEGINLGYCLWQPSDILYVRETWSTNSLFDDLKPSELDPRGIGCIRYWADGKRSHGRMRPSIFMPKWAARLFLKVKNIRVERVQDISGEDQHAEGLGHEFAFYWDKLNKKRGYGWGANPWVWVIEFERHENTD